jgi:hypothetical protein
MRKIATALLIAFAVQASACSFNVKDAPDDARARTGSSVEESNDYHHNPFTYVTSAVASVVYLPAKVIFAVAGGAVSAVSYIVTLGNPYPARSIWNASVDGDYLVTPLMIEGGDTVHFVGN